MKTDAERHKTFEAFLADIQKVQFMTPTLWANLIKTFDKEGTTDLSCKIGRTPAALQVVERLRKESLITKDWVEAFVAAGAFRYHVSAQSFRDACNRTVLLSDRVLVAGGVENVKNPIVLKTPEGEPFEVDFNCTTPVQVILDESKMAQFGLGAWFKAGEIKGFVWVDGKYVVGENDLLNHFKLSFADGSLFRCNGMSAICTHGGSCGRSDIKIQDLVIHARERPNPIGNHCRVWRMTDLPTCPRSIPPPIPSPTDPLSDSILMNAVTVPGNLVTLKDPKGDSYQVEFKSKSTVRVVVDMMRKDFGRGAWFKCDDIKGFVWMDGEERVADEDVYKHFQLSFPRGSLYRNAGMSAICTHSGGAGDASTLFGGGGGGAGGVRTSDICVMLGLEFRHLVIHPHRLPPTEGYRCACVTFHATARPAPPSPPAPPAPPARPAPPAPPAPPAARPAPLAPPVYKFRDLFLEPGIEHALLTCSGKKGMELKDDEGKLHVFDIVPLKEENPPRALLEMVSEKDILWFRRGGLRGLVMMTTKDYDGQNFVKNHAELGWNVQRDGYSLLKVGRMMVLTNRWGSSMNGVLHIQGDHDDLIIRHISGPTDGNSLNEIHGITATRSIGGSVVSFGGGARVVVSGAIFSDGDVDLSAVG